jgi:hypothetical protein
VTAYYAFIAVLLAGMTLRVAAARAGDRGIAGVAET